MRNIKKFLQDGKQIQWKRLSPVAHQVLLTRRQNGFHRNTKELLPPCTEEHGKLGVETEERCQVYIGWYHDAPFTSYSLKKVNQWAQGHGIRHTAEGKLSLKPGPKANIYIYH